MHARRTQRGDRGGIPLQQQESLPRGGRAGRSEPGGLTRFVDFVFGRLSTNCGYTQGEIRGLEMADVYRLLDFWKLNPPPADMLLVLATAKSWKPPADAPAPSERQGGHTIAELRARFPAGVMKPGM